MPRPNRVKVCSTPGCPAFADPGKSRCHVHERAADNSREGRGAYSSRGHRAFRRAVLKRDVLCQLCGALATVADHYPLTRRELVDQGLNPNDPNAGRGLCAACHNRATATDPRTRGGWNDR